MSIVHSKRYQNFIFSFGLIMLLIAKLAAAQERVEGTAIIRVQADEYTIPIECNDAKRPMLGVFTEPARITRERTNRSSGVHLTIRPWKDTDDLIVSLDRYVAWVSSPPGAGGVLNLLKLDMSPLSKIDNGIPALLSYEDWEKGNRPEGLNDVFIRADCRNRDAESPSYRKLNEEEMKTN